MSFLAIDIGNTRLKWGQYASPFPGAPLIAHGAVFLETIDTLADTEWKHLAPPGSMLGCVVAGEGIRRRVEEQLELWDIDPRWVVSSAHAAGVTNGYDHPGRLGTDRWVALIGARQRVLSHGGPRPVLVVMVGTAVTVDALDADGNFLGGLILPGFGVMQRALEMSTAGLKVPTGEIVDFPTNTSDALMTGGSSAMVGAVERMHRNLRERCGQEPVLLMSGGASPKLAAITDLKFETVERLVFDGLLALQSHRLAL
ncbi:type III pantothenate kinase [Rhizobacter sp. Root1221]|uniref:type III pantothenate kinase n=1 Tax=Rhizobacter sp. Root1221 TaxID=1736433 RepID=UPI000700A7E8|nr:type III pantothenate kinase [Rhizobacter sp. Root1221]KQV91694.1 type III pantothenate kinase [Rhizobacter sp. Root1221]